jgi:hypothetical protein
MTFTHKVATVSQSRVLEGLRSLKLKPEDLFFIHCTQAVMSSI